ncbi:MAG: family 10 glycosylhydrolase [Victivallales bacterium]|nr:family 10 glycosylhydrolase [Victivallales bacterium]
MAQRIYIFMLLLLMCLGVSGSSVTMQELSRDIITSGAAGQVRLAAKGQVCLLDGEFATPGSSRACWDLPLKRHDLTAIAGIRIRLRCLNAALASHVTIHVQCGGSWYSAPLSPRGDSSWEEIFIPKSALMPETNQCGSWKDARTLRFASWKGADGKFQWQLSALEFVPAAGGTAILRTGTASGVASGVRRSAMNYSRTMGEALTAGGARPGIIDEADATPALLRKFSCIIVPATGDSSPATTVALASYLRGGGKALVFHDVPRAVSEAMGLPPAKFRKSNTLARPLAAVATPYGTTFSQSSTAFMEVGAIRPPMQIRAYWVDTANKRTAFPAIIQTPRGMWMTHVYLNQNPERGIPLLVNLINDLAPGFKDAASHVVMDGIRFAAANAPDGGRSQRLRNAVSRAGVRAGSNDYPGLLAASAEISNIIADAGMPVEYRPPKADEIRGAWMRSPNGLAGKDWNSTMKMLNADGFNAVFPLMASPHQANHAALTQATAAAKRHGIALHPWIMLLNLDGVPENIRREYAARGQLQVNLSGTPTPWLCPVNPANRKALKELVTSIAKRHSVEGIHLDMIRYESSSYCYCSHCRNAFTRYIGHNPQGWPECTLAGGRERQKWLLFRQEQIRTLLKMLADAVRQTRPGCIVSAAVFPEPSVAASSVAQNWKTWLDARHIDFAAPMTYRPTASLFNNDISRIGSYIGAANSARILPGIGLTTNKLTAGDIARQIQATRAANAAGFIVFEYTNANAGKAKVMKQ